MKNEKRVVNPRGQGHVPVLDRIIQVVRDIFNITLGKHALRNVIALTLSQHMRINEISRHLPIKVKGEKQKQKRLMIKFEKSGSRWMKELYPKRKVYSLPRVIKRILRDSWYDLRLDPYFPLHPLPS